METTPIVIGLEGALLICVTIFGTVVGTGFLVWKASKDAHAKIQDELCSIRINQAAMRKDIQWLVRLQGGQPHINEEQ